MWEKGIDINEVREIRTRTNTFFGVGAIQKTGEIAASLKGQGIDHVLVVTGRGSYKSCGAWDVVTRELQAHNIGWELYDKVTPNPTADQVDDAAELGRKSGAGAVIAIGGGSPIDAGKSAAILLKYPDKTARDIYEFTFAPAAAVPIVAINITHGTGTEVNRFAVVTIPEKEYKPAIAYDCIYPTWSIDDPALTAGLSPNQTRYVSIDAVNHVIEAATTIAASPYSVMLGKETIRLVAKYLPLALQDPSDLEARYFLMYAAMLAGVAFDNGLLHYTHALEHPLSAVRPELSHGLGLAILLPAVVENIYARSPEVLADLLSGPVPGLKGEAGEAKTAAAGVEKWLFSLDVTSKLKDEGFSEGDIPKLIELTFSTPSLSGLLELAPTLATKEVVEQIYRDSMQPMN
ncbi:iron-containing alcohol dehydrogenase [Lentisphaerota bacterium ZTH]|nr:iron-containing alcohol dehydrogenase [Lentisphaerota bacterium]WET07069.1 iron-containing alcohol dehydrogenase [Lentisphaerota bacterium ZTH]